MTCKKCKQVIKCLWLGTLTHLSFYDCIVQNSQLFLMHLSMRQAGTFFTEPENTEIAIFSKKILLTPRPDALHEGGADFSFSNFRCHASSIHMSIFHNENPHRISRAGDFFLSFQLYISQSFNRAWVRGLQMEGTKSLAWVFYYFMSMSLSPPFIISWNNNKSHKITTTRIHFFSMMNFSFRFLLSWWISFSFYIS